jgi:hypothetical protein
MSTDTPTQAAPAPATNPQQKRKGSWFLNLFGKNDPVQNNKGWRFWFFGEGAGATAAIMLAVYLWLIPWEPTVTQGVRIAVLWLGFAHAIAWYTDAQQSGLVSATDRRNLGNDKLPVQAMILSVLSVGICVIALVLAGFVWFLHFQQGFDPGVLGLSLSKLGVISVVMRVCWSDLTHNATMLGRAQRLTPEMRVEQAAVQN